MGRVVTPYVKDSVRHIYHVYAIRSKKRDELFNRFKANGVGTVIHYPIPLHLQKAYENLGYKSGDFPIAEMLAKEVISLPMFPHIKESQIKFIVKIIKEIV
jgi:dTDP-4-amino-4,6-dideoxygalactose transaminase